ncbi:cytochrome c-type biogenesis protein [Arenibaculum pallidiluteum]|uniref:cytochrome c-type biogenesis protein n=1 Tax=Arenibaculum pallidiluteum TaxID=2812559 RepID=UPI001A965225|nr:cytochrome c-type biogenesis protein [Arenibaculum pallidiluteum]
MIRSFAAMLFAVLVLAAPGPGAWAVQPDEVLPDPAQEARAREISRELRCLVCQNQSIDDSNAPLARDLRVIVRERITAGDTDTQVLDFVVGRYGDFVLLRPPFKPETLALWLGPAAILAAGLCGVLIFLRRRRRTAGTEVPLTAEEERRIAALLGGEER